MHNSIIYNPTIHFDTVSQNISVVVSQFGCSDTLYSVVSFTNPVASINSANLVTLMLLMQVTVVRLRSIEVGERASINSASVTF